MSAIDAKRPSGHRQRIRRDRVLLLLMLPGLGYFLVFHYGALFGNILASSTTCRSWASAAASGSA